jgi:hypothetical protein
MYKSIKWKKEVHPLSLQNENLSIRYWMEVYVSSAVTRNLSRGVNNFGLLVLDLDQKLKKKNQFRFTECVLNQNLSCYTGCRFVLNGNHSCSFAQQEAILVSRIYANYPKDTVPSKSFLALSKWHDFFLFILKSQCQYVFVVDNRRNPLTVSGWLLFFVWSFSILLLCHFVFLNKLKK